MKTSLAASLAMVAALVMAPSAQASIECVQDSLDVLGYNPGPVDGVPGSRTTAAARNFATDYRLKLPGLSRGTSAEWCTALLGPAGGAGAMAGRFREPADIQPGADGCVTDPPDGYTHQIRGLVDGDELTIRVSAQFGGAVESLVWRDKEFINIYDHGRQISYAWFLDDYGGCLNPTEPGSDHDLFGLSSTSELRSVCSRTGNTLTTTTLPAYWVPPGAAEGEGGFCSGGATSAVNETAVATGQPLEKTITIGHRGLANVIAFDASITLDEDYRSNQVEIPTAYMTHEFTSYWRINPATGKLSRPGGVIPPDAPWSFMDFGAEPPILATPDGEYAMGAYTAEPILSYSILGYDSRNPANGTNKWNMVIREEPADAGTYRYQSFAIVGTLESVKNTMMALYRLHPIEFAPPMGHVDAANCQEVAGWAWDPKAPDEPIEVEFYGVEEDGSRSLLSSALADGFRRDLPPVLGDNGRHGYAIATREILPNGGRRTIIVEAKNSIDGLQNRPLLPPVHHLECADLSR